mmetsp:Transcript_33974/g.56201  ORF Transcript_33974/g.56201 Transcript_33974/m.56201 type:complete len:217 (+) Transcript_33974:731-1381(+)
MQPSRSTDEASMAMLDVCSIVVVLRADGRTSMSRYALASPKAILACSTSSRAAWCAASTRCAGAPHARSSNECCENEATLACSASAAFIQCAPSAARSSSVAGRIGLAATAQSPPPLEMMPACRTCPPTTKGRPITIPGPHWHTSGSASGISPQWHSRPPNLGPQLSKVHSIGSVPRSGQVSFRQPPGGIIKRRLWSLSGSSSRLHGFASDGHGLP